MQINFQELVDVAKRPRPSPRTAAIGEVSLTRIAF
jgi:hypothetical protein